MPADQRSSQSNSPGRPPRSELGRLANALGLSMHEEPSPPGSAPWEKDYCHECGEDSINCVCGLYDEDCPICGETNCCEDTHG